MKLNPWFVSGLIDGEGCFCISISKHKTNKTGFDPRLMFEVEMIIEDKPLLERLRETLNCGHLYILNYERYGWRPHVKFAVKNHNDIITKIIPFFQKYPLQGKKKKDFEFFCKAAFVFNNKRQRTEEGLLELRLIQSQMNLRNKFKQSSAKVRENRVPSGERSIDG
jgi:hypothetical protein